MKVLCADAVLVLVMTDLCADAVLVWAMMLLGSHDTVKTLEYTKVIMSMNLASSFSPLLGK